MHYPEPISKLIDSFMKLPGIGPKTAARLAFFVLGMKEDTVLDFAKALVDAKRNLSFCTICGHITDTDPCRICPAPRRRLRRRPLRGSRPGTRALRCERRPTPRRRQPPRARQAPSGPPRGWRAASAPGNRPACRISAPPTRKSPPTASPAPCVFWDMMSGSAWGPTSIP